MFKLIMCIILMGGTIHAMNENNKALVKKEDSPPLPTKKPSGPINFIKNLGNNSNNNNNNSTALRISDEDLGEKRLMLPQTLANHIEDLLILLKKPLPVPNLTSEFEAFKLQLLTEVKSLHNQRKQFEGLAMRKIDGIALVCAGAFFLNLFVIHYFMNHYK